MDVLKPNITQLAVVFGVSRQAIYAWKAGESISENNADKLDDLNRAADIFVTAGMADAGRLMRRKFDGGRNLFDIVREGGSARLAATALIEIVRTEEAQRRALDFRLKSRASLPVIVDDIGLPMTTDRG